MGVTLVGSGGSGAGATSAFTMASPPTGTAAGDLIVIEIVGKYAATSLPTNNNGYTLIRSGSGGAGTTGNDAGVVFAMVYAKIAGASEGSTTFTFGATLPNSYIWRSRTYRSDSGTFDNSIGLNPTWTVPFVADTNTASPMSATLASISVAVGDYVAFMLANPSDVHATVSNITSPLTFEPATIINSSTISATGADSSFMYLMGKASAAYSGTPTVGFTVASGNASGIIGAYIIRDPGGSVSTPFSGWGIPI